MLTKHGLYGIPEYYAYRSMIDRCNNKKCKNYHNYGGRGIKVCERWRNSFACFISDMGRKPSKKHSIERINNNGGYCKENCKWVTWDIQANNKRTNVFYTLFNQTNTLAVWCRKLGIIRSTVENRIRSGWAFEDSVYQSLRLENAIRKLGNQ